MNPSPPARDAANPRAVKKEYDRLAPTYDKRWRGYLEATHAAARELAGGFEGDTVLDASGGTGIFWEGVLASGSFPKHLTIVDISGEMLAVARQRLGGRGDVAFLKADVENWLPGLEAEQFSKILCTSALHFYKDPEKALANFHAMLQPGGRLILIDWRRDSLHFKLFDWLKRAFTTTHIKTYSSGELLAMVRNAGFEPQEVRRFSHGLWSLIGVSCVKKPQEIRG